MGNDQAILQLLMRVRARWRALGLFHAIVQAALIASAALLTAVVAAQAIGRSPLVLVALFATMLAVALGAFVWNLASLRHPPSDKRLARFIEERVPGLDDRLATAVDLLDSHSSRRESATDVPAVEATFAGPMLADAASHVRGIDLDAILPADVLRRTGLRAAGAAIILIVAAFIASGPARESLDAASLVVFPSRVTLQVQPGNARVVAGRPLTIEARLVNNRAPIAADLQIADGDEWRTTAMTRGADGAFRLALDSVTTPFRYRVAADTLTSPSFAVTIARPPRVTRIDLDYTYPSGLGLTPRSEQDSGDIYAPRDTEVRVRVHTDRPADRGRLALGDGKALSLSIDQPTLLWATFKIVEDASYRVALVDAEGLASDGDTEYFIRVLEDRAPEVHITRPAGDRSVTRLEEVDIEAQADDDYGIDRLELVYSVRGGAEKAIALDVPKHATSVTVKRTLYLEDLDVQPGDFVSYYVRARDLTRGSRANQARSDIFFLDVRPYEQEFSLAQSQSMAGAGYAGAIDDLVNVQRQVVVATWKLDRRADSSRGARSERDIRSVSRMEADLRARVEQTASSFRESTMRDPRSRAPGATPAGQPRPEEDAMAAAGVAMGKAVTALEALDTARALPPEMEALNHLLRAQAEVKRRQVSLNQSASGASGNNNRNYDISTLFDRELRRQQQTSYETPKGPDRRQQPEPDALDKIRDLAKRQDELLRKQQELAHTQMDAEERRRQLEQLTREQSDLRERAEELTRQMSERSNQTQNSAGQNTRSGPSLEQGRTGNSGGDSANRQKMRDASDAMRDATAGLRRGTPDKAGTSAARALESLRDLERTLQASQPDERKRALGEMRLEARQLADRQRQVASELQKNGPRESASDNARRLAGEEERLADRAQRLQENMKQAARADRAAAQDRKAQAAVEQAARDFVGLADRMRQSAGDLRAGQKRGDEQQDIARQLDRLAERLGAVAGDTDDESRKLSEQLARAQELRENLDRSGRALEGAGRQSGRAGQNSPEKAPGESGRIGQGRQGAGGSDLNELREESLRQLRETKNLLDELRRNDPSFSKNGAGFTFEGQGMVLSAPGTERFKQDFARWDALKRQAQAALEQAEAALSKKLQANQSKDRLAGGIEDKAPSEYQKLVDSYFKALAAKKP